MPKGLDELFELHYVPIFQETVDLGDSRPIEHNLLPLLLLKTTNLLVEVIVQGTIPIDGLIPSLDRIDGDRGAFEGSEGLIYLLKLLVDGANGLVALRVEHDNLAIIIVQGEGLLVKLLLISPGLETLLETFNDEVTLVDRPFCVLLC